MQAQMTATFGTGTSSTSSGGSAGSPMSGGTVFSYTQNIYTAAELTAAGVPAGAIITAIEFSNGTGESLVLHNCRTYMTHRSTTSFTSATDYTPYNQLTLVDSSDWVTTGSGWFTVNLHSPFVWNGTGNLLIAVSYGGASLGGSNIGYNYTTQTESRHWRRGCRLNNGPVDAVYASYPEYTSTSTPSGTAFTTLPTVSTYRPNLRITYIMSGCPSLMPNVATVTAYTADLNWINFQQSVSYWDLAYGEASTFDTLTATIVSSITDTFYTLTGLLPATNYTAKLKPHCSNGDGPWSAPRTFATAVTCPAPTNVQATGVLSDGCTLTWTAGASETSWDIYIPTGTEVPSTSTIPTSTTTTPSYTVTGLSAVTEYTVYVRANCGTDDYSFWIPVTFRTACGAITTLPYTENFDSSTGTTSTSVSTNNLPNCWDYHNTGTSTSYSGYPIIYNSSTYAHSGSNSMRFYTYTTAGTYSSQTAILPPIDPNIYPINTLQLVCQVRALSTSYPFILVVGVMSNSSNINTFTPVDTITVTSTTYSEYTFYFSQYTGQGNRIAIMAPKPTSGYNYGYVDDIVVEPAPSCIKPTNISVNNITSNSVTVGWTSETNHQGWEVAAVPHGGNVSSVTPEYASTNPYTLTNLNSSTTYDLYVRADCGGGDYSAWNMVSFITACTEISALPFVETFDNVTGATSTAVSTNNLPICWNHLCGTYSSYAGYPIVYNSSTYAASGTNALRFYTYTGSTDYGDQYAILPPIDVNTLPLSGLQLTMDVRKNSTSYASFTLIVGVMGNPAVASSFVPVDTIVETGTNYEGYTVDFSNYTGTGNYIALLAPKQTSVTYNTGYVDNIRVEAIPSCDYPTDLMVNNVASTTAFVDWTPGSAENMWEVIILQAGQNISNAIVETATAHPYELTNLADNTPYTVYVRAYCPSGGYSGLSSPVSFTTLPLCTSPRNLSVSQITGSSALVSWDEAIIGAVDYTVEYTEYGMNNWMPTVVNGTSTLLAGLMPQTQYSVRVSSNCTTSSAAAVNAAFTTRCLTGGTVQIGSGTSTSSYLPSYSQSTRSYSQQIFKKEELGAAGTIDTLSIEMSTADSARSVSIYLMHTSATNIFSWIPTSGAQLVYSGSPALHSGWNAIPLTQSFAYNGVDNLLVVVIDNTGRAESASPYNSYRTHTAFPASARYTTGSTYSISSVPSSAGTVLSTRNNIKFGMACDNNVACVAPNVAPTSVTDESITLEWVPGYTENSWVLEYRAGNGNWIQEGTVYNSPYTITNLTPGTPYSVRLRSDCGGSYSDWAGFNTETECSTLLLPYSENFDNTAGSGQGNMVPCWKTLTNYTTAYPYTSSSYHHSGNYSVYFYGTSAYYSYLVSPRFDDLVQMNNLQVRFWAYKTSAAYEIELGIMSDPTDVATFESIGIFSPSENSTWEKFERNTSNYMGTGHYIAFRMPAGMTSYMYLDDVDVYEIPACDHVDNVHTTGTPTTTSVDVTWTPRGTETQWNVVYGLQGTITDPSAMTPTVVYTPTATLTNLQHSSFYDVYVQADCGSDTSGWEHGVVNTACDRISTLPYMENFENYRGGSSSDNVMPLCWNRLNTGTTAAGCPTVYSSTSTYLSSGTKGLYFYATTASTSADQYAILPEIDVNTIPINTLRLSFKARRYSSTATYVNTIIVGVMTNITSASSFVPVDTVTLTSTTIGTHHVDFTNYTGTGSHIAIKVPKPSGSFTSASYNYLDDILLDVAPACAYPTNLQVSNITTNEVTVSWTAGGNENEWEMVLVQGNASMNTGTTYNIYTNSETLYNLTPGTDYTVYLRAVCPQGGYSEYITESFSTQCEDLQTLPFTCNFDNVTGSTSGTVNNLPVCWGNLSGTYSSYAGYPIVYNSSSYAASGSNSLRFYTGTTTTYDYGNQYAVLPPIDVNLNPINTLQMTMDVRKYSTSYANVTLIVGVMTDPATASTFVPVDTIVHTETSYSNYTVYFGNYAGSGKYITIMAPHVGMNGITYNTGHVDNIVVDLAPVCPPVTNVQVSNVGAGSALITWEEGVVGSASSFVLEYTEYNQSNWTPVTGITGTSYMLSGLTPGTHYEVRVQADCGSDVSTWTTTDFSTKCLGSVDFAVGTGTSTSGYFPSYSNWKNAYSQQIFLASELNGSGDISSLSIEMTAVSQQRNFKIYMMHTTQSTSSTWIPAQNAQLCFQGPHTLTVGWNTFDFNTPFHYNGTDNLVLIFIDENATFVNGNTYRVHTVPTNTSHLWYSDTETYSISSTPGGTSYSTTTYRNNVKFSICDSTVTCAAPNMHISNVDQTSAEVTWAPGYMESTWNLEYKEASDTVWNSITGVTGSSYTITGLNPSSLYNVRMQSDCGGGDLSPWVTEEFYTLCSAMSIPFTENFDGVVGATSTTISINNLPHCWNHLCGTYSSYAGYPAIYSSSTYAASGTNALRFYTYTGTTDYGDQYAILPAIDVNTYPISGLQLTMDVRKNSTSYNEFTLIVGVMDNPADRNSFVPVDTIVETGTTYVERIVYFNNYTGTGTYIALMAPRQTSSSYNTGYVDNIAVEVIPSCPKPNGLTATSVSANSITLGWNDPASSSSWNIEYGPAGFTQGQGTVVVANSNPFTITGLTANTNYTFYVQSNCGGGDLSSFSSAYSARTACDAITTLPFTEGFDNYGTGTATAYPPCWTKYSTYTNSTALPYCSSTHYAGTGSLYLYVATSGTYNMAILPPFDASIPINTLQATFMHRGTNSTDRTIVGVMSNPADPNTFIPVDTVYPASTASTWTEREVVFSNYTGTGQYIAFMNHYTTTNCYTYVDNLSIDLIPTCPKPTHLTVSAPTTTSLNLSWTENGTASNWVVEYGIAGFTQGTGSTVNVQGTPSTTITGLSASSTYDFYVKSVCGAGDESYWSVKATGATLCGTITQLPYSENFDAYGISSLPSSGATAPMPNCWERINTYSSGVRPFCYTTYNYNSTAGLYFYASSGSYNIAVMPELDASIPVNTLKVSFMYRGFSTSYTTPMSVGVMTDPMNASTYVEVATVPFDATITNWVSREVSFANYTGSGRFIAFRNGSSSATTYAMIDNLVLNYDSTQVGGCAFPTGVTASGITQTSATITWTPGGSENTWELQYKEASSSNWSNSVNVTGTPSHNLTGLTAGTQYQVRVRAVCSTTETSIWAQASFTTASVPVTPPTVTTQAADNISSSAATLHGTIVPGSENITSRGFEWKETANGSYTAVTATSNTMSHNLTNLTPSTEYTFRAFAITASGTTYGAAMTFTTQTPQQDTCPTPTNVTVTNITSNTAVVSWTQAPGTASSWNVLYKESAADSWYTLTVTSPTTTLAGLTSSTSYDVQVIAHCTNGLESDPSATVTLTTTGINDYALDNSVTVFPNPTTGVVQIKNGEWRMENVEVYDAYGKLLYEMNVNDHTVNLDLGGYAKGTYFVRVTTERGVVTKRVVKN